MCFVVQLMAVTNLDQESLFSLELIVDRLQFHHSVECRIPAVAFRLLDFPTLLIYHVEPELAATIRSKLLGDRYRTLPAQLSELKDHKTDAFSICRGKSCLFSVSPNKIVSSLCSAPLYIMVVDMFPETPKLVGSCSVPLSACARDLYNDIVTNSISVPAVQAEKKELDLCNLMGKKLGTILLGYRLLSLGTALLSHIPTRNILHLKPTEEIHLSADPTLGDDSQPITESHIVTQQSTAAEQRSENVDIDSIVNKLFTDSQTQMEPRSFGSVGTQTFGQRLHTNKLKTAASVVNSAVDDWITTNVLCPPPLFYNSATCKKTTWWNQEEWSSLWHTADDGVSNDGTIRMEDKYLDADEETTCNEGLNSRIVTDPHAKSKNVVKSDPAGTRTLHHSGNMTGFPILSALMAEILCFQGKNLILDGRGLEADQETRYKFQETKKLTKQHDSAVERKRSAHRCANVPQHDKRHILLRRTSSGPSVYQKQYFAGMTNTQRLRLAKTNPKLLQELETKEMQRRKDFRTSRARVKSQRQKKGVLTVSQPNVENVDTLEHIDITKATEYIDESRESTARYKCPVPTPRTSKMRVTEQQLFDRNVPDVDVSGFGTNTYTTSYTKMEDHHPRQSSSEENFQFALPVTEDNDVNSQSVYHRQPAVKNTTADSNLAERQVAINPKQNTVGLDDLNTGPVTLSNFGQTQSVSPSVLHGVDSAGNAQSDITDAGGLLSLEDLGLRKIVDHYSGDSDGDDKTEASSDDEMLKEKYVERDAVQEGKELSDDKLPQNGGKGHEPEPLRKIANQYSCVSEDEQSDVEYEHDFEDTAAMSLKTVSTVNSSTSSAVDSAMRRRILSGRQEFDANVDTFDHPQLVGSLG